GVLLMAPLGALTARRMRAIRQIHRGGSARTLELLGAVRDPLLKASLGVRIAAFVGIFLLVSVKPGLLESIVLVGGFLILGLLFSVADWRRSDPRLSIGAD